MTGWSGRPQIVAAYLNPALMSMLIATAARGYSQRGQQMPWPMAFLVAPLVLHRPTREALPGNTRTHMSTWVQRNALVRAGIPARAASLAPIVSEGIRFGVRHRVIVIDDGRLRPGRAVRVQEEGDLADLVAAASLVGRWLSRSRAASMPFALLGVSV